VSAGNPDPFSKFHYAVGVQIQDATYAVVGFKPKTPRMSSVHQQPELKNPLFRKGSRVYAVYAVVGVQTQDATDEFSTPTTRTKEFYFLEKDRESPAFGCWCAALLLKSFSFEHQQRRKYTNNPN